MNYQKLFDHMCEAHALILLESEMEEIVRAVSECKSDKSLNGCDCMAFKKGVDCWNLECKAYRVNKI
jgi:hypothetical protein